MLVKMFRQHLQRAFELEKGEAAPVASLQALQEKVEVVRHKDTGLRKLRRLARMRGLLAFDYETTGLKPDRREHEIVSCGFCLNGKDTWACMIDSSLHEALSQVLRSEGLLKIASNLKFEERWTRAKLGHGVGGWYWDTMQAAHVLDNRSGITSVKFQAYIHLGVGDYESAVSPFLHTKSSNGLNRIREANLHELLLYNGLDSLLEYRVAQKQMAQLGVKGEG